MTLFIVSPALSQLKTWRVHSSSICKTQAKIQYFTLLKIVSTVCVIFSSYSDLSHLHPKGLRTLIYLLRWVFIYTCACMWRLMGARYWFDEALMEISLFRSEILMQKSWIIIPWTKLFSRTKFDWAGLWGNIFVPGLLKTRRTRACSTLRWARQQSTGCRLLGAPNYQIIYF